MKPHALCLYAFVSVGPFQGLNQLAVHEIWYLKYNNLYRLCVIRAF